MNKIFMEKEAIPVEVTFLSIPLPSKEAAEEVLAFIDKPVAVAFHEDVADSDEVLQSAEKIKKLEEKLEQYIAECTVRKFQAKNITCRFCESSVAKEFLKSDICPVCGHDLRKQSIIDGEMQQRQKIEDAKAVMAIQKDVDRVKSGRIVWMTNADVPEGTVACEEPEAVTETVTETVIDTKPEEACEDCNVVTD